MSAHVIHIGDTHGDDGPRSGDVWAALDEIATAGEGLAAKGVLAAWAWPGDLLHTISDVDTRNRLQRYAQRLAAAAPVLIVGGNHDHRGELDVFARLAARWPIHVWTGQPTREVLDGPVVPLDVVALPYPRPAGLIAAGTPPDQIVATAARVLAGLVEYLTLTPPAEGAVPLVLGHATLAGAVASTGQPLIGQEITFDPAWFAGLDPRWYVGFNHIHKHQAIGQCVYAGSICRLDFGEVEPKGYIEVVWDDAGARPRWRFCPLDVPAMYRVEGRLALDGFTIDKVNGAPFVCLTDLLPKDRGLVIIQEDGPDVAGADVRVRYTADEALGPMAVAHIHARFAGARTLKIDRVRNETRALRAPEVVAAATVAGKVEALAARQGRPWTPALADKLGALETGYVDLAAMLAKIETIGATE
jgi:hypothetical protein